MLYDERTEFRLMDLAIRVGDQFPEDCFEASIDDILQPEANFRNLDVYQQSHETWLRSIFRLRFMKKVQLNVLMASEALISAKQKKWNVREMQDSKDYRKEIAGYEESYMQQLQERLIQNHMNEDPKMREYSQKVRGFTFKPLYSLHRKGETASLSAIKTLVYLPQSKGFHSISNELLIARGDDSLLMDTDMFYTKKFAKSERDKVKAFFR
jgi:hypothetical protein